MRAVVVDRWGGPDELRLTDVPAPSAGAGRVVVRVMYAGVNPADWKCREGWLASYFESQFPFVLGFDGAGTVVATGEGVSHVAAGDRVVLVANQGGGEPGTYAELVGVPADLVVRLPDDVDLLDAAVLPTAGITARRAVVDVAQIGPGDTVLVHGAAGGTGSYAVQLAKAAGAVVAGSCSSSNVDYVRSLGADLVVDYRTEEIPTAVQRWRPDGVDAVIDCVGQGTLLDAVDLVRSGGVVAAIGTLIAEEPRPDLTRAAAREVRYITTMATRESQPVHLASLVEALSEGALRSPAIHVLDLDEVATAHRLVQDGHVRGKIALRVTGP